MPNKRNQDAPPAPTGVAPEAEPEAAESATDGLLFDVDENILMEERNQINVDRLSFDDLKIARSLAIHLAVEDGAKPFQKQFGHYAYVSRMPMARQMLAAYRFFKKLEAQGGFDVE